MISIHNCWHCNKKLETFNEEHPFHCSIECKKQCKLENYQPKQEEDKEEK